jgi:hypothetical protein
MSCYSKSFIEVTKLHFNACLHEMYKNACTLTLFEKISISLSFKLYKKTLLLHVLNDNLLSDALGESDSFMVFTSAPFYNSSFAIVSWP